MRLSIPRSLLAEHLQAVAKAVPVRTSISVLEGIMLEGDGEKMTLTATNLEIGIQSSFPAAHTEGGKVVLPAKVVDIVRRLPGESVQLRVDSSNFLTDIVSGQAEFQLYGYNPEEFPSFPSLADKRNEVKVNFTVLAADLKLALRQTLYAVSHDESKPAFTGVLFELASGCLVLSASDTFRLAVTTCPVNNNSPAGQGRFLVPSRTLHEVLRVFADDEQEINAVVLHNQLLFESKETKIASRLLEENFPDVSRVIPKEFSGIARIDTSKFQQAVERATLLSEGINHIVRLSLGSSTMVVRSSSKYGKIQEQIPILLEGEELEIALNARFLLDMLKVCEGEQVIFKHTGFNRSCIMQDALHEDNLYLVLPVKS